MTNNRNEAAKLNEETREQRRTVIPTPRNNSVFAGWGVRI
jgi:hypothetical protein